MDSYMMILSKELVGLKTYQFSLRIREALYGVTWMATTDEGKILKVAGKIQKEKPDGIEVAITTIKNWGQSAYKNFDEKSICLCPLISVDLTDFIEQYHGRLAVHGNAVEIRGGLFAVAVGNAILPLITVDSTHVFTNADENGFWPIVNVEGLPDDFGAEEFTKYFAIEVLDAVKKDNIWQLAFPSHEDARNALNAINYSLMDDQEVTCWMQRVINSEHKVILSDMHYDVTALDVADFLEKYEIDVIKISGVKNGSAELYFRSKNVADGALVKLNAAIENCGFKHVKASR